jgi:hypothetical protein
MTTNLPAHIFKHKGQCIRLDRVAFYCESERNPGTVHVWIDTISEESGTSFTDEAATAFLAAFDAYHSGQATASPPGWRSDWADDLRGIQGPPKPAPMTIEEAVERWPNIFIRAWHKSFSAFSGFKTIGPDGKHKPNHVFDDWPTCLSAIERAMGSEENK